MKSKYIVYFAACVLLFAGDAFATASRITTQDYVDSAVATKQDKLTGTEGYAVLYGVIAGATSEREIVTSLTNEGTSSVKIPTSGAVISALADKQDTMSGSANTVVTYTGISGGVSSRGIYQSSGTLANQSSSLAQAGHLNAAVTNAFNAHLTCHTYANGYNSGAEHCLLWDVNSLSSTYIPQNQ